jgi:hypothetical protein
MYFTLFKCQLITEILKQAYSPHSARAFRDTGNKNPIPITTHSQSDTSALQKFFALEMTKPPKGGVIPSANQHQSDVNLTSS